MNNEDIFMAVGDADDVLLDDAIIKRSYGKRRALRIAGIAAAAVLAAGCTALIVVKLRIKAPDITANNDPTASPAAATASAPTPAPTPTPLPTPEPTPLLDLTGWNVGTGEEGEPDNEEAVRDPGSIMIHEKLKAELEKNDDEKTLYRIRLIILNRYDDKGERVDTSEYWLEKWERKEKIERDFVFAKFRSEFYEWYYNIYFPDCPYKDSAADLHPGYMGDEWRDPDALLYDTLLHPDYPNYYELFLNYLIENGEEEKAETYRPKAEEHWEALYKLNYERPQETMDAITEDFKRLIGEGYRIDLDSYDEISFGWTAYLTKEQILDFDADKHFAYFLGFSAEDYACHDE